MPEEEKKDSQVEEKKPEKKKGPLILVFSSLVLFVVFVGIFSYLLGVFNQQTEGKAANNIDESVDLYSHSEKPLNSETQEDFLLGTDSVDLTQMDSVAQMSWFEKEKKDLIEQGKALEVEKRELELLKLELESLLAKKKSVEEKKITMLAELYDGMKAEQVAQVMENLDDSTIVAILPNMKAQQAAKVLGLLSPKRAAKISNQLMALK